MPTKTKIPKLCLLQQVTDDVLTILTVGSERYMHPIGALCAVLHDKLVKDDVRLNPVKSPLAFDAVAVYTEVGSLAIHVLAVADTANGCVEPRAPVSATYLYLMPHRVA